MILIFKARRTLVSGIYGTSTTSMEHGIVMRILPDAAPFLKVRKHLVNRYGEAPMFADDTYFDDMKEFVAQLENALSVELGGDWSVPMRDLTYHEDEDSPEAQAHISYIMTQAGYDVEGTRNLGLSTQATLLVKMNVILGARDLQQAADVAEMLGEGELSVADMLQAGVDVEMKDLVISVMAVTSRSDEHWRDVRALMRHGYVPYRTGLTHHEGLVPRAQEGLGELAARLVLGRTMPPLSRTGAFFLFQKAYMLGPYSERVIELLQHGPGEGRRLLSPEEMLGEMAKAEVRIAPPMKRSRWVRVLTRDMM